MKIFCIGDSLALPGHTNMYEDTWFCKLKIHYPQHDFISFFKRKITTDVLVSMGGGENTEHAFPTGADCLEYYMPNIVIVQLGIVDCAPRLINDKSIIWKIVRRMPNVIVNKYINYLKKNTTRNPKNVIISESIFQSNLINYFDRCKKWNVDKLIYISIAIPSQEMVDKNSTIIENVVKFNNIIKTLAKNYNFIDVIEPLKGDILEDIYEDGYHPNPKGNDLVFQALVSHIS
ncbi:MAG: SGNH/GDSL hydrolase family protein [Bacteroidota bacterium]